MDQLVALPIKGESFLLKKGGRYVLVDGGYNSTSLTKALNRHNPSIGLIDIVICTHADEDHAGGLSDIIDTSGFQIGEFWLPGAWIDSAEELLLSPRQVMKELIEELDKLLAEPQQELTGTTQEIENSLNNKVIAERQRERAEKDWTQQNEIRQGNLIARMRERKDEILDATSKAGQAFRSARRRVNYRSQNRKVPPGLTLYWLDLIETAKNIRAIAEQAIKHNVDIRWFDFNQFSGTRIAAGGDKDYLEPLNSVEYEPAPIPKHALSWLSKLSPVNEECLAFFSPPYFGTLGVIFCGDSPMGDGLNYANSFLAPTNRPDWPVVATAPHHGSESNAIAYNHVSSWASVATWIRTGGSIKQPGSSYKNIPVTHRMCTYCPQTGKAYGKAEIYISALWIRYPLWILMKHCSHECNCK